MRLSPNTQSTVLSGPFISVGGTSFSAPSRLVAAYTMQDPNSVSSSETDSAGYIQLAMTNTAVVSGLPNTGVSLTASIQDVFGTVTDCDIYNLLQSLFIYAGNDDPPSADLRIGAFFANGLPNAATVGYGVALTASGTDWIVSHLTCVSSTWTNNVASTASANTRGARAIGTHVTSTNQRSVRACGLDSTSTELSVTNIASAVSTAAITDNLTHFGLFGGWATGVGGSATNVLLNGFELVLKRPEIPGTARP